MADGEYRPDESAADPTGDDDRDKSFELNDFVHLLGGFAGGETLVTQRNPSVNLSILTGDLAEDDTGGLGDASRDENTLSVVSALNMSSDAVIDGFIITAGNATSFGGGIRLSGSAPIIRGCTIVENQVAGSGGGMPESVGDCMDIAEQAGSIGSQAYETALKKCIEYLCAQELIECD